MTSSDLGDIFESSLNLEERHLQEGYDEGYDDGLASGREEGREVGLKVGFEVGEELGFYKGCVEVWKTAFEICPDGFSARVQRNVKQMAELIERYPILEPENEGVQDLMDALRTKFKAVSAMLSVRLEYQGFPGLKAEDKDGF
ncbi:unnamed protein product [Victoria cruziana]